MAITYITGIMGSGKTYLAVHEIYKFFFPNKKNKLKNEDDNLKKYMCCYTNIDSFRFDLFNDKVRSFDFSIFKRHLDCLHSLYNTGSTDLELISYCKDNEIYDSLFVVDEVQNFLGKADSVLIWWLTYHRHLHHDLIFITQNLNLIANEYKQIAEYFYRASDSSKRLFYSRFRYVRFGDYRMYKNSIIDGGGINLKFDDEVFSLYHSGNVVKPKNVIQKYIIAAIFLLVIAISFFFLIMSLFKDKSSEPKKTDQNISAVSSTPVKSVKLKSDNLFNSSFDENSFFYRISCFSDLCFISSSSNEKYNSLPRSLFFKILLKNAPLYRFEESSSYSMNYYLIYGSDVFYFLKNYKDRKNEKNTLDSDSVKFPSIGR